MTRDELAAAILAAQAEQERLIVERPEPPKWQWWEADALAADTEYGPKWSPSWSGAAIATNAGRQRVLRCVHGLARAGLLIVTVTEGGRRDRLQLTEEG